MKIRQGFVSNSSSSSFIVIGNSELMMKDAFKNETFIIGNDGNTEFGWEFETYSSVFDKINFAYIQAMSTNNQEWLELLDQTITNHLGCSNIENNLTLDYHDKNKIHAYIDHQSCATEGQNIEMFDSEHNLLQFLFANDSYIEGGNDNV